MMMMKVPCTRWGWGLFLLTVVTAFGMLMAPVGQTEAGAFAAKRGAGDKTSGSNRVALYAAVGAELTQYDLDVDGGALVKRGLVTLPENVQEAWIHPSRRFLYVVWSNRGASDIGPGTRAVPGEGHHGATTFRIDPASGALQLQGEPVALPARPIYVTTDIPGTHLLVAYNNPSGVTVHQINRDGTIGAQVKPLAPLDVGIYAHQVRVDPSNKTVILVTRGNKATSSRAADLGALKIFGYKDGLLTNRLSIASNGGFNFPVRHLDFHPTRPWVFVGLGSQNKLYVYRKLRDGTLSSAPMFLKDTLADPGNVRPAQQLASVHVHPNGKFVYVNNRADGTTDFEGEAVFAGGENNIAVFAINQGTGEPTLIQNIDTRGIHPRTFALDPSGRILVAANIMPLPVRQGATVSIIPASLAVFRVGGDGKLEFARKYDIEAGGTKELLWVGIVSLP